jgi:hypothetical protein
MEAISGRGVGDRTRTFALNYVRASGVTRDD